MLRSLKRADEGPGQGVTIRHEGARCESVHPVEKISHPVLQTTKRDVPN